MASMTVNRKTVSRWGIYNIKKKLPGNNFVIGDVIEKPSIKKAPSNKAVIGRYILPRTIFNKLKKQKKGEIFEKLNYLERIFEKDLNNKDIVMIKGSNATGLFKISQNLKKGKINVI